MLPSFSPVAAAAASSSSSCTPSSTFAVLGTAAMTTTSHDTIAKRQRNSISPILPVDDDEKKQQVASCTIFLDKLYCRGVPESELFIKEPLFFATNNEVYRVEACPLTSRVFDLMSKKRDEIRQRLLEEFAASAVASSSSSSSSSASSPPLPPPQHQQTAWLMKSTEHATNFLPVMAVLEVGTEVLVVTNQATWIWRGELSTLHEHQSGMDGKCAIINELMLELWGQTPWFNHWMRHWALQGTSMIVLDHDPCESSPEYKITPVSEMRSMLQGVPFYEWDGKKRRRIRMIPDPVKMWKTSGHCRRVDRIFYDPSCAPLFECGTGLNTFVGYACKPVPPLPGEPPAPHIMDFFHRVIAGGTEEHKRILITLLAQKVQSPAKKLAVCIVLRSESHGTGKNTFVDILRGIWGRNMSEIQDVDRLVSKFNSIICGKSWIVLNEVTKLDSKKEASLKNFITEYHQTVEKKFHDPFEQVNCADCVLVSNEPRLFKDSTVTENRRYFMLEVDPHMDVLERKKYFNDLRAALPTEVPQLLWYLQTFSIPEDFNIHTTLLEMNPTSGAIKERIGSSPILEWFRNHLKEGTCELEGGVLFFGPDEICVDKESLAGAFRKTIVKLGWNRGAKGVDKTVKVDFTSPLMTTTMLTQNFNHLFGKNVIQHDHKYKIPRVQHLRDAFAEVTLKNASYAWN